MKSKRSGKSRTTSWGHEEHDDLTAKADAAFRQAALKVIQRKRQYGTPIVIWRDNRVEEISPDSAEMIALEKKLKRELRKSRVAD